MERSELELTLEGQLRALVLAKELPPFETEFAFGLPRKWRADFAWPAEGLLVEVEGAVRTQGRHTRGSGFIKDIAKYNTATILGYALLRFDGESVKDGTAVATILEWFKARRAHER